MYIPKTLLDKLQGAQHVDDKRELLEGALKAYFQGSEVDHTVNIRMRLEHLIEVLLFPDIDIVELRSLAGDKLDPIDCLFGRIEQVVHNNDFVAGLEEGKRCEGPNVSATTSKN